MATTTPYVSLEQTRHPVETAGVASMATMAWLDPLIRRGARTPLNEADVWPLCQRDTAAAVHDRFQRYWQQERQATAPALHKAIWRTFRCEILATIGLYLVSAGLTLLQPWVIKAILEYLQAPSGHVSTSLGISSGYGLAGLLAGSSIVSIACADYAQYVAAHIGCNVKTIFVDSVYLQTLALSSISKQHVSSGDVVAMATIDAEKMLQGFWLGIWSLVAPAMLLVIMILIGVELGMVTGLIGGAFMLLFMVAGYVSGTRVGAVKRRLLAVQAERVKLMNEVLQGIRVVKLYAWEKDMEAHISAVRAREFELIKTFQALRVLNTVTLFAAPLVTMAVVWVCYIGLGHDMDATKAFTVMALLNAALLPCTIFSNAVMYASEAYASSQRVNKFLLLETMPPAPPTPAPRAACVSLRDAAFAWEDTSLVLHDLQLELRGPSLTVLVGPVGSGKSSLVQAILGEMHQLLGVRDIAGSVAYASQEPWIQHDTLRNNILFADAFDDAKYNAVLDACQLRADLAMLPDGDATEIGERGINLSGGQKARVALARALYKTDADLVLLDDPLSALDVHVASAVFTDGLQRLLQHKTTLLVLNSHYHLLAHADRVLVLDHGRIVADGAYTDVMTACPHLVTSARAMTTSSPEATTSEAPDVAKKQKTPCGLVAQEERAVGAVSVTTYVKYFGASGWNGRYVGASVLLSYLVCQGVVVSGDLYLSHWSNASVLRASSVASSWSYASIIVAAVLLVWGRSMFALFVAQRCSQSLHTHLLRKVLSLAVPTFFDVTPIGRILNRFSTDLDLLDAQVPFYGFMLLQFLFQILAVLLVCGASTPYVILVYPCMLFSFYEVQQCFNPTASALKRLESVTRSPLITSVSETLHGLSTIRAFGMAPAFLQKHRRQLDHHMQFFSTFYMARAWFQMRLDWLSAAIVVVVAFLVIGLRTSLGVVAAGLSLTYAAQLSAFLSKCAMFYNTVDTMMTSVERLAHYESLESEDDAATMGPAPDAWPKHPTIAFEHVAMRYRSHLPRVLQDVHVHVAAKDKIGICGRTGSGKSSLISALFRIVPIDAGAIRIDGVNIANLPVQQLRSTLTIIPQDPVLFSGSLRFNLDPSGLASDADLYSALTRVHLASYVATRGGLELQVKEKGGNLSVGQRQLLCIARALLRDTKIVVLDEATANVDAASDRRIQDAVRSCFADVTLLVIAHRLETILHCDKILVLHQGRVVEYDTPTTLLAKDGGAFQGLMQQAGLD
ncbi:hypothetical protein SPRG_01607 [Saprolegnia parasitica CBS 223.65]|uniref:ATP-binding Cassette (ABC) Superfamily n=1 Tax=Saprolegnia parasitica (strain CBS 223.65) TaxID=695850 RepID=A0A067D3Q6_SAPPC|nr:hypothetical protein SPRG_01607 [Saprolegnia parasitica CBS 223.65]KDO33637.1 hypothetical protein SPRG_01607 [Saprolegnia parasitica CBS 223.65]|eukprot:XP_012195365.1 hypothetical protein SPRG_01607 [Saprolegnia parasitica CBS 223.65]